MADADLRDAEREAARRPDDVAAGHAWLAAADRAGDPVQATRALGHLARLGDARGYDLLRTRTPWPHTGGHGASKFLAVDAPDDPLVGALLGTPPPIAVSRDVVVVPEHAGRRCAVNTPDGRTAWRTAASVWHSSVWSTSTAMAVLERDDLVLRTPTSGDPLHAVRVPTTSPERLAIEADRVLAAGDDGGAVCLDLAAQPGLVVWDTRVDAPPPARTVAYDPACTYRPGDVVTHPTFGEGAVARADARRVSITFPGGERTLAHGGSKAELQRPVRVALDRPLRRVLLVGSVALLEDERRVTALDARTGSFLWATEGPAKLAAADVRGVVLHQHADPRERAATWSLVEVEPRTGLETWFFPSSGGGLVALGERVALAVRTKTKGWVDREAERELVAVDRASGSVRWRRANEGQVWAVTRRHALVRRVGGAPRAVDIEDGADAPMPA